MTPQDGLEIYKTISSGGIWGLVVFFAIVHVVTQAITIKIFKGMIDEKEATNRKFSDVIDRQSEAFNRRTRAENMRTEVEALQLAARSDIHPDLKNAAAESVRRIKDELQDTGLATG